jgi:hypothetical protein
MADFSATAAKPPQPTEVGQDLLAHRVIGPSLTRAAQPVTRSADDDAARPYSTSTIDDTNQQISDVPNSPSALKPLGSDGHHALDQELPEMAPGIQPLPVASTTAAPPVSAFLSAASSELASQAHASDRLLRVLRRAIHGNSRAIGTGPAPVVDKPWYRKLISTLYRRY